ncbi:hypothetical protein V6N11_079322 [Hibiscus sabdariffa]|uniref:Cytochrome P450 n=1 Tax=Hibiscus sabdariffa TaxID=183260 RepID=A0ABR2RVE3_9ROSI
MNRGDSSIKNTMITHLLSLQESQPQYYTDLIIKGLIQAILNAGTDTTELTLEWAISTLLNNPQVLVKAIAELDQHIGQEKLVEEADVAKVSNKAIDMTEGQGITMPKLEPLEAMCKATQLGKKLLA